MKRVIALILALLMVFTLVGCGQQQGSNTPASTPKDNDNPASGDAEPEVIKLSFVHQWKADSLQQKYQFEGYFDLLEEELDGKYVFEIDYFPTGTLLNGPDIYQGIVDGVVNIGATTPAFFTERYVAWNYILVPGVMARKTAAAGGRINQAFYEEFQMSEMDDVKLLFAFGGVPNMIHSTKPIHTLEDLQGMTIRTSGASAAIVTALGGTPISMDYGEVLSSAQKGLIDACWGTAEDLQNYNLAEVFPYSTYVEDMGGNVLYVIMNKNAYSALPVEVQTAMDNIAWKAVALSGGVWDYNGQQASAWAIETYDHEFIYRDDAEIARWAELVSAQKDAYIEKLDAAGYDSAAMTEKLAELTEIYDSIEYNPWTPEQGYNFDPGTLKVE